MSRPLPQRFYARECLEVAVDLLGKLLCLGPVVLRITEVEAYRHPGDTANHCRFGRTARNAPMWGPPGHAYVYLCYGMHALLNLVTDGEAEGAAVLIRACEPVSGHAQIAERRKGQTGPASLAGPGNVAAALGLDVRFSGRSLLDAEGLFVADQPRAQRLLVGPRVGVDYAEPMHRVAPWRLALPDTRWVSQRASLRALQPSLPAFLDSQRQVSNVTPASAPVTRADRTVRPRAADLAQPGRRASRRT
jgi:DNA-3-methyladenine glycosylase